MNASTQRRYEAPTIDLSQIPIGHYYLLRADNERSRRYVSSLIGGGSLTVRESEVWRGKTGNGQSGSSILHAIDTQLHGIFLAMGLPNPETDMKSTVHQKHPSKSTNGCFLLEQIRGWPSMTSVESPIERRSIGTLTPIDGRKL